MTMITPSYLGETIEYSSLHACRSTLEDPTGFTGILLMGLPGPLNQDQQEQLQTIEGGATHLLSLINDLLDLAKIESGKIELLREEVIGQSVVQDVVTTLRSIAEAKGLRLMAVVPQAALVIETDRRALTQILLNLTNNAIKFTEEGEVRIELGQSHGGKAETVISVTDTGLGIRSEDHGKLFQAFQQINGAGPGRQKGTGLGLHLSQKLAHLLGGRILFQSEFGEGSKFTLILEDR